MRGILFKTVKEGFRKLHRKHKAEVRRFKRDPNTAPPVIPMSLKKADFKRKIRGTKFTGAAEFKAKPGLKRRLIVGIEKGRRVKKKLRKPIIYGKAFASDKKGKTLQIQPLTYKQRRLMKKEMAESAKNLYKKMFLSKKRSKGGMNIVKKVKTKLEKASAAHAGQAKALGKVIDKKKLLLGGLLTKGIKSAAKKYFKTGNKTQEIVKKSKVSRKVAKEDVKSGIRYVLRNRLSDQHRAFKKDESNFLIRRKKLMTIRNLTKLK